MNGTNNFDMPGPKESFEKRGGWVVNHLVLDLAPLTLVQAAGIVGNLGGESGLQAINEKVPLRPGSRGGWSWAQWTGDRRVKFEEFCKENGFDLSSDEGAYKFLVLELNGPENKSLVQLRKTTDLESAVYTFEVLFERPSDPQGGLKSRIRFAQMALVGAQGKVMEKENVVSESEEEITKRLNLEQLEPNLSVKSVNELTTKEVVRLTEQTPPARTSPGVALAVGGSFTSTFATTIQYIGPWNWPLSKPDDLQALAVAGFVLTAGATVFHLWANGKSKKNFNKELEE